MTETTTSFSDQEYNQSQPEIENQGEVNHYNKIVLTLLDSDIQSPPEELVNRILSYSKQLK